MRISDWSSDVCSSDLQKQRQVLAEIDQEAKQSVHCASRGVVPPPAQSSPCSGLAPVMVAVGLRMNDVGEELVKRCDGYFLLNIYLDGYFRSTSQISMTPPVEPLRRRGVGNQTRSEERRVGKE